MLNTLKNTEILTDQDTTISIADLLARAKYTILFFYPKNDTSGCNIENTEFDSLKEQFLALDAQLVGVSADNVAKHQKYKAKYNLNHTLVADEDLTLCKAFGVWVEKKMYGKVFFGIQRATWIFDQQGNIVENWPKVTPKGHAQTVLERVQTAHNE